MFGGLTERKSVHQRMNKTLGADIVGCRSGCHADDQFGNVTQRGRAYASTLDPHDDVVSDDLAQSVVVQPSFGTYFGLRPAWPGVGVSNRRSLADLGHRVITPLEEVQDRCIEDAGPLLRRVVAGVRRDAELGVLQ